MDKEEFLSLLQSDGFNVECYYNCKNIVASDSNGYKYKISKWNYLSGKKPHWIERNPYVIENIRNYFRLNCPELSLVSDKYVNCKSKLDFVCNKHKDKGVQSRSLDNIVHNGRRCHFCTIENLNNTIDSKIVEDRCKELGLEYIEKYVSSDSQSRIKFICPIHVDKGLQDIAWYHLKSCAKGCAYCAGKRKTTEDFSKDIHMINPSVKIIGEYRGYQNNISCECLKCGYLWETSPSSLRNGSGCPKCTFSKGEEYISSILDDYSVEYIPQKSFDGCVYKSPLKFDFFIPKCNLAIEYDGQQHFFPVDFGGKGEDWANAQFQNTKIKDEIKTRYCKDNNINLIRISYYDFERIPEIMTPVLQEFFLCKNL